MIDFSRVPREYDWRSEAKSSPDALLWEVLLPEMPFSKTIRSPLREDKTPSFRIFPCEGGVHRWKDFATGESGDVWSLWMRLHGATFSEALHEAACAMNLLPHQTRLPRTPLAPASEHGMKHGGQLVENLWFERSFTRTDAEFWASYGCRMDSVQRYRVRKADMVYAIPKDGNPFKQYAYSFSDPCYLLGAEDARPHLAGSLRGKARLYRCLNKERKWSGTLGSGLYGACSLDASFQAHGGALLLIASSCKDAMCLHSMGYRALWPSTESQEIHAAEISSLREQGYEPCLFYDNDAAGKRAAAMLSERLLVPFALLEGPDKDISDFYRSHGAAAAAKAAAVAISNPLSC